MNQEKIGQFIATCRKQKKLTQAQLAEELGVTDRSVSNWENGKCMPDYSLLIPLSKELNISVNELISGEKLNETNYEEKCEKNIINIIDENKKNLDKKYKIIGLFIFTVGFLIIIASILLFPTESSWSTIYSVFGAIVATIGFALVARKLNFRYRIAFIFILTFFMLLIDFTNVKLNDKAPLFSMNIVTIDDTIFYDTPFYDVYRCNKNQKNESWHIEKNGEYNDNIIMNYCKTKY
ncbi:MAG: helix-turn-helix transcriptional regulator [Bacilli bacterium]|nr:helix-turn-helix transcriptional regulator [Bacilli bacterium]